MWSLQSDGVYSSLYRGVVSTVVSTERWSLDRSLEVIKAGFTVLWCTTKCALVQLAHDQVVSIERWSLYRSLRSLRQVSLCSGAIGTPPSDLYREVVSTVVSTERWSLDRSLEVIKAGFTVLWCTTKCALVQLAHDQVVSIERWSLYRSLRSLRQVSLCSGAIGTPPSDLYREVVSTVVSTERWSLDRSLEVLKQVSQ